MKSLEEIKKIREEKRKQLDLRINLKANTSEKHILVCHGTGCTSSKSEEIIQIIESKDRTKAGKTLPPYALYLVKVEY